VFFSLREIFDQNGHLRSDFEGGLLKYVFLEVNYLDATIEKFRLQK